MYVVEDYGAGKVAILLPSAPAAFSDPTKIVERNRVELLDVNLAEFTKVLGHWGVGTSEMKINKNAQNKHPLIKILKTQIIKVTGIH